MKISMSSTTSLYSGFIKSTDRDPNDLQTKNIFTVCLSKLESRTESFFKTTHIIAGIAERGGGGGDAPPPPHTDFGRSVNPYNSTKGGGADYDQNVSTIPAP